MKKIVLLMWWYTLQKNKKDIIFLKDIHLGGYLDNSQHIELKIFIYVLLRFIWKTVQIINN